MGDYQFRSIAGRSCSSGHESVHVSERASLYDLSCPLGYLHQSPHTHAKVAMPRLRAPPHSHTPHPAGSSSTSAPELTIALPHLELVTPISLPHLELVVTPSSISRPATWSSPPHPSSGPAPPPSCGAFVLPHMAWSGSSSWMGAEYCFQSLDGSPVGCMNNDNRCPFWVWVSRWESC
jgi:hypothetical protein